VGGGLASFALPRLPVAATLAMSSVLLAAVMLVVHRLPADSSGAFMVACVPFGLLWLFVLPFHVALAFQADRSGRLAGLVPAAQLLGSAVGPLTASFIVEGESAAPVPLLGAAFAMAAAVVLMVPRGRRASPVRG
jgi:MFS transporter, DHA1 family, inner membrane transport protein